MSVFRLEHVYVLFTSCLPLFTSWGKTSPYLGEKEPVAGLGRGSYVVGAQWDEGNMVHAMKRFGGTTVGWRFGDG